jgi:competence ComEA-like helix-hairpin-helix protein
MTRILAAVLVALALLAPHAAAQGSDRAVMKSAPAGLVNLNTATAAQLEALPGIGARTAALIVEYRQKNGGFKKIEEILETSRSCPVLLRIPRFDPVWTVSESRQKSQEISQ